jgi:hypothetical protein
LNATDAPTDPPALARAAQHAREMYPQADVRVIRGRVVVFDGDVIRLVRFSSAADSGS